MKSKIISVLIKIYSYIKVIRIHDTIPLVLIYEKEKSRVEFLNKALIDLIRINKIQLITVSNKYDFILYSKYADFIFAYGMSSFMDTSKLRFLYLGEVGQTNYNSGFEIYNAPNFVAQHISDYVVASVFAYERGILQNLWLRNNKKWNQKAYINLTGKNLKDLRIGIIGLGNIGSSCAKSFKDFGCEVHGFDKIESKKDCVNYYYSESSLFEMLMMIDYLIITISNNNNKHFVDDFFISKLNPNCCIVNVSRGSVIDENAMIHAIENRKIRGAILDVFNIEPLSPKNRLWKLKDTILSPHISGNIDLVFDKIAQDFSNKIRKYLQDV